MRGKQSTTLFSFVGNRDPYSNVDDQTFGPLLSLLETQTYDTVYLFCTGADYTERARTVEEISKTMNPETLFSFVSLDLKSPVDYEEIFSKLKTGIDKILASSRSNNCEVSILTDSGTPQMQTAWFLLAKSGYLDARLLQGVPPKYAAGAYKVKEIDLNSPIFPEITMTAEEKETPFRGSSSILYQSEPVAPDTVPKAGVWITVGSVKIIGESPAFLQAFETASRVAGYGDISVLISGETGTGKELVARLIHEKSERANKPFLPINCSSIAPTLAESELFGYKKGAFTGAHNERLGLFRAAEGGTVFLDEIGEMPIELQPKLLRVLEEKKVMPIGFDRELPVDVRVLAATNQKLEDRIEKGLFRRDLYERIRQVVIELPPLRERGADIPLLAREFLRQWNDEYGETKRFTEELPSCFTEYPWPSNVRGLQNAVSHICAISQSDLLTVELLPTDLLEYFNRDKKKTEFNLTLPENGVDINAMIYQIKEHFFKQALYQTEGNREKAASLLGLNPPAFRKALREQFDIE